MNPRLSGVFLNYNIETLSPLSPITLLWLNPVNILFCLLRPWNSSLPLASRAPSFSKFPSLCWCPCWVPSLAQHLRVAASQDSALGLFLSLLYMLSLGQLIHCSDFIYPVYADSFQIAISSLDLFPALEMSVSSCSVSDCTWAPHSYCTPSTAKADLAAKLGPCPSQWLVPPFTLWSLCL